MTRLDHLREILNERGDATTVIERDLGDVHRRARRHRKPTVLAGALASIVVVATVALAAAAIGVGGDHHDVQVNTGSRTDTEPSTPIAAPLTTTRTLADGTQVGASLAAAPVVFGPYGQHDRWVQPADCPADVAVNIGPTVGDREQITVRGLDRTTAMRMGLASWPSPNDHSTENYVAVVARATPGDTYRLLAGDQPLDSSTASAGLIVLVGTAATSPTSTTAAGSGLHVQRLEGAQLVSDQPLHQASDPAPSRRCSAPTSPTGVRKTVSNATSAAAISSVIGALLPPGGSPTAGLTHVEDPAGRLHALVATARIPGGLTTTARDVEQISSSRAWVRYGFAVQGESTATAPYAFDTWAEVRSAHGEWTVTTESYCALLSAIGSQCPGGVAYTPLPEPGQFLLPSTALTSPTTAAPR